MTTSDAKQKLNIYPTHPQPTKYLGVATWQILRLHDLGKELIVILTKSSEFPSQIFTIYDEFIKNSACALKGPTALSFVRMSACCCSELTKIVLISPHFTRHLIK